MAAVHGCAPRGLVDGALSFALQAVGLSKATSYGLVELAKAGSAADLAVLFALGGDRSAVEPTHQLHLYIRKQHENAATEKNNGGGGPGLTTGH